MTKFLAAAIAAAILAAGPVHAQTKIQIGCTATSDCASAMVAVDEASSRNTVSMPMVLIGINSNIPAAILSNSIEIGGPTSTVFLQAVDGGLDLVAVAGASMMNPTSNVNIAAFVRNGVSIKEPKDFIGKKVGAPGLGAFLHVLFVKWLVEKGIDPKSVNFVEVTFPTMADIIKSGGVDVVLTAEPFVTRMTNAGLGTVGARYGAELAGPSPSSSMRRRATGPRKTLIPSGNSAPRLRRERKSSTPIAKKPGRRSRNSPNSRSNL